MPRWSRTGETESSEIEHVTSVYNVTYGHPINIFILYAGGIGY